MNSILKEYQKVPVVEYYKIVNSYPVVSVCVQTYNHVHFIKACLDGILMQKTNFQFEILLGEDESSDGTREICIEYAEKNPDKIRLFLHSRENNIKIGGQPSGRFNLLYNLSNARGKYIALCEGDDYWTDPLKLQKQVEFLEGNPDYVVAYHDASIIDDHGKTIKDSKLPKEYKRDFSAEDLKKGNWVLTLTMVFRNVLKDPAPQLNGVKNGDTALISRLGRFGKGHYMPEINPAAYRVHEGGVWSKKSNFQKWKNTRRTFFKLAEYHKQFNDIEVYNHFLESAKRRTEQMFIEAYRYKNLSDFLYSYFLYSQNYPVFRQRALFFSTHSKVFKYFKKISQINSFKSKTE